LSLLLSFPLLNFLLFGFESFPPPHTVGQTLPYLFFTSSEAAPRRFLVAHDR
jgi:hypothetical protein